MNDFEKDLIDRLARIEENLKDHIRRTELLEHSLKPLQKHVDYMNGTLKFLGVMSLISALALTIGKLFN